MKLKGLLSLYILHLVVWNVASIQNTDAKSQAEILKKFASGFNTSTSIAFSTWKSENPCDGTWSGIVCTGAGVVKILDLNGNWLRGSIPSVVGELVWLKSLYLYNNFLTGTIPSELGNLVATEQIWLHNNGLSGNIPSSLGNLKNCKELSLFENELSGAIPKSLGIIKSLRVTPGNNLCSTTPGVSCAANYTVPPSSPPPNHPSPPPPPSPKPPTPPQSPPNRPSVPPPPPANAPPKISPPSENTTPPPVKSSPPPRPNVSPPPVTPAVSKKPPPSSTPWTNSPPIPHISYSPPPPEDVEGSPAPSPEVSPTLPPISPTPPTHSPPPPATYTSLCKGKNPCPTGQTFGADDSCTCVNATQLVLRFTQLNISVYTVEMENEILEKVASGLSVGVNQLRVTSRRQGSIILDIDLLPINSTAFTPSEKLNISKQLSSMEKGFPPEYTYVVLSPIDSSSNNSKNNILIAVLAGVVGGAVLIFLCLVALFCFFRKKHSIKDVNIATPPVGSPPRPLQKSAGEADKHKTNDGVDVTDKTWPETPLRRTANIFSGFWSRGSAGQKDNNEINTTPKPSKEGGTGGVTDSGVKRLEEGEKNLSPLQTMSRRVLSFFPLNHKKDLRELEKAAQTVEVHQHSNSLTSTDTNAPRRVDAFSLRMIQAATKDFNKANLIGERSYGRLYKANLSAGEKALVAVLSGDKIDTIEFLKHTQLLSSVRNSALVPLIGYSGEKGQRILLFSYMPNGSLADHLHGEMRIGRQLNWHRRVRVARDVAEGLAYLHDVVNPPMYHRDLQAANILLDQGYHAKLADYGMSTLLNSGHKSAGSSGVLDSIPYQAPEFRSTGLVSDKSDVFSFGVLLLELFTGRKPVDSSRPKGQQNLIYWVLPHAESRRALQSMVDPHLRLNSSLDPRTLQRFVMLAKQCLQPKPETRPKMTAVVKELRQLISEDSSAENSQQSNGNTTRRQSGSLAPTVEEAEPTVDDSQTVTDTTGEDDTVVSTENGHDANGKAPTHPTAQAEESRHHPQAQGGNSGALPAANVEEWDRIRELSKQYPLGLEGWEAVRKSVHVSNEFK